MTTAVKHIPNISKFQSFVDSWTPVDYESHQLVTIPSKKEVVPVVRAGRSLLHSSRGTVPVPWVLRPTFRQALNGVSQTCWGRGEVMLKAARYSNY